MPASEPFDLTNPPWSVEAGGTGNSDDWGDEQDRAEWFEEAAYWWAQRAAEARVALESRALTEEERLVFGQATSDYLEGLHASDLPLEDPETLARLERHVHAIARKVYGEP